MGKMPTAYMSKKPRDRTTDFEFYFAATEPGCKFEYRVYDPVDYKVVKDWTPVVKKADVRWLDRRNGGPGNGEYIMYVRAIDPAGNFDIKYDNGRNFYKWYYISPLPWDIIAEGIGSFIGLGIFGYLEYRRRMKKAAMERYAMKRMRRKFKALQKDIEGGEVDWRHLYNESKANDGKRKGKSKDKIDAAKKKRLEEKKKRDKDKEAIKKKLKAGKDFKDKKKKQAKETGAKDPKERKKKDKKRIAPDPDEEKDDDEPVRLKEHEKKDPRFKEHEKKDPKFKDYEKSGEPPKSADPMESGAKQRKTNKKYKDYEQKDGDKSGEPPK